MSNLTASYIAIMLISIAANANAATYSYEKQMLIIDEFARKAKVVMAFVGSDHVEPVSNNELVSLRSVNLDPQMTEKLFARSLESRIPYWKVVPYKTSWGKVYIVVQRGNTIVIDSAPLWLETFRLKIDSFHGTSDKLFDQVEVNNQVFINWPYARSLPLLFGGTQLTSPIVLKKTDCTLTEMFINQLISLQKKVNFGLLVGLVEAHHGELEKKTNDSPYREVMIFIDSKEHFPEKNDGDNKKSLVELFQTARIRGTNSRK